MNIRGERILIFGDSLSHHGADNAPEVWNVDAGSNRTSSAPGDLLASMLLERGAAAVRTDARVGRSAMNFYSRENAKQLLADDLLWAPTKVVVMLGTNDIGRSPDGTRTAMTAIRDTFRGAGAEVWAIGPVLYVAPNEALNAGAISVVDIMKSVFSGRFIDARYLTEEAGALQNRAKDGVHFTATSARPMAETLASTLSAKLSPTVWWTIGAVAAGVGAAWGGWHLISARMKKRGTGAQIAGADKLRLEIADYEAVDAIREAAKAGKRFGGRKVFLSSIVDMKDPQTRRVLLALRRDGLIELTRADLVASMDPKLVKASELDADGATYHFLVDDREPGLGSYPDKGAMDPTWFTGGCLTMAEALKRRLGRGAKLIDVVEPEEDSPFIHSGRPHHVVVEHKGVYWDAAGPHSKEELLSWWAKEGGTQLRLEPHSRARARDQRLVIKPHLTPAADVAAAQIVSKPLGDIDINILRHENKWMKIGGNPKASGYKQIPCKSGLDKKSDGTFRVRCWTR